MGRDFYLFVVGYLKTISLLGHRAQITGIIRLLKAAQLGTSKLNVTLKTMFKNRYCQVIVVNGEKLSLWKVALQGWS